MQLALLYPDILIRWFRDGGEVVDAEKIVQKATERAMAMQKLQLATQVEAGGEVQPGTPSGGNTEEEFGTNAGETEREGEAIS